MFVFFNIIEVLIVLVPILMAIAFVTIAERKVMAAMQRRVGPNAVGLWGLLQPFADALKLLVKEIIIPRQSNSFLFVLGPCITLVFALLGWAIIPFGEGLTIFDYDLGVFFALAVSSLGGYGILISGWAANSKYSFMGAVRATAQLLSYELVFSSIVLILIMFSGSFSFTYIAECQQAVWNIFPLMPIALAFFIAILAETNRPPFDLAEAESELVAGFMTEHAASVFVFFFLGEYSSLILMSAFMSVFFLGGYHCPDIHKLIFDPFVHTIIYIQPAIIPASFSTFADLYLELPSSPSYEDFSNMELKSIENSSWFYDVHDYTGKETVLDSISLLIDKIYGSYILGFKIITVVFFFIWVRASFPRLRYDQLMSLCWKELLPLVFAYIIFTICLFFTFDMMPFGTSF
jgi:NADH-ubiquinone oxidoreductase chain 1